MGRGVDKNFIVIAIVLVVAAVFLSNISPSISGMGGTSVDGQGVSMTTEAVSGYYRGLSTARSMSAKTCRCNCPPDHVEMPSGSETTDGGSFGPAFGTGGQFYAIVLLNPENPDPKNVYTTCMDRKACTRSPCYCVKFPLPTDQRRAAALKRTCAII